MNESSYESRHEASAGSVFFETLTGPETAIIDEPPLLIIPLGSIEQHGPHLPINTDTIIAARLSEAIVQQVGGLVAPAVTYGCMSQPVSGGGELLAGTVSLTGNTYTALIADLLSSYTRRGYKRLVLLNGHMENSPFAIEGATCAARLNSRFRAIVVNWWEVLEVKHLDDIFNGGFPGWGSEHAGVMETSLMMHLEPEMVRNDLIQRRITDVVPPVYTVVPERPGLIDPSGVLWTADGSSAEIGRRLVSEIVNQVTTILTSDPYTSK
jgi:creatinine amidohydrolase